MQERPGGGRIHMSKTVRRKTQRDAFKKNVQKLQRAGLLGDIDLRKKADAKTIKAIEKYRAVLSGKSTTVKAPDLETARRLRKALGLKGSGKTLIIPREKGERYKFQKSTGEIVSERPGYIKGEKIRKTLGSGFPAEPSAGSNKRLYYTIPERTRGSQKLKRTTFGSFNEMLFYMSKYDIRFEDVEDRIEVEEITRGGRADKRRQKTIHAEREASYKRKRRKKRAIKKGRKKAKR
jgi:hypothetical protein